MNIGLLKLKDFNIKDSDKRIFKYISPGRLSQIKRYRNERDRKTCLYSYLLAVMMIHQHTASKILPDFVIRRYGKPCVESETVFFNISHSGSLIACATSKHAELGIDVELIRKAPMQIIRKCFTKNEINIADSLAEADLNKFFFKTWTRKEAYLKYRGTGINSNLNEIDTLKAIGNTTFDSFEYMNYSCSLCSEGKEKVHKREYTEKIILAFINNLRRKA